MLLVKTRIQESSIHGISLFADEYIKKGTCLWKFIPNFDLKLPQPIVQILPMEAQKFFAHYGYLSKKSNHVILPTDHARFTNHSDSPNCDSQYSDTEEEVVTIALRDITPGEEITEDYQRFEKR